MRNSNLSVCKEKLHLGHTQAGAYTNIISGTPKHVLFSKYYDYQTEDEIGGECSMHWQIKMRTFWLQISGGKRPQ
jgi:hypothetical protein